MGRYEYSSRGLIEETTGLSIRDLKSWGLLSPGDVHTMRLNLLYNGEPYTTLYLTCALPRPDLFCQDNYFEIAYTFNGIPIVKRYTIEPVACFYGGYRFYFWCTPCRKRVTALYLVGKRFQCRHCGRLVYQLCRENRGFLKQIHRAEILREKACVLKRQGHPRKAKRLRVKAGRIEGVIDFSKDKGGDNN